MPPKSCHIAAMISRRCVLACLLLFYSGCATRNAVQQPPPPPLPKPAVTAEDVKQLSDKVDQAIKAAQDATDAATKAATAANSIKGIESVGDVQKKLQDLQTSVDSANKTAQSAADTAKTTFAAIQQGASDLMNKIGTNATIQSQALAQQGQVNTLAAAPKTSLADYIPCVLPYGVEAGYRLGYLGSDPADQETNALVIAQNTDIVPPEHQKDFLALIHNMAGANSLLIGAALERKGYIKQGTSALVGTQLMQSSGPSAGQPDVGCSQSILSYDEANAIFGRAIAKTYIVIQVNARNLNGDQEFLMHDVQVAVADIQNTDFATNQNDRGEATKGTLKSRFVSGRDKTLARGVATTGQLDSPRNVAERVIEAIGAVGGATSLAIGAVGAAGTFKDAMQVFTTAVVPQYGKLFPDHTIDQLNRLNDLGFSSSSAYKIVIPKNGTVPFVTFLPTKVFAENYNTWTHQEMWDFQKNTFVVIAGKHITETTDDLQVATMTCPHTANAQYLDFSQVTAGNVSCSVAGSNLQKLTSVRLVNGKDATDKTTVDSNNITSAAPNTSATATFTLTDLYKLPAPQYLAYLNPSTTANGTATTIRVNLPPYISGATFNNAAISSSAPLSAATCTAATPCAVVLQGHNLNLIQSAALLTKDNKSTSANITVGTSASDGSTLQLQINLTGVTVSAAAAYNLQVTAGGDAISPPFPLNIGP